jgi:hypothetical protein
LAVSVTRVERAGIKITRAFAANRSWAKVPTRALESGVLSDKKARVVGA